MRRLLTVVSLVGLAVVSLGVAPAAAELNVCIKNSSGKMRAVTSLADCNPATESGEALATSAALAAAEVRITALEALLMGVTRSAGPPDTLVFTGMNLQVVNGTGATDGLPNGVGNVIIGYDVNSGDDKSGSHNLVIGDGHTYASHSGVVTGLNNTLSDAVAFVGGGFGNTAGALRSFVGGGSGNTAGNVNSFVGGGNRNTASDPHAFVGGGFNNTASGRVSFVGGGLGNSAIGLHSFVGGGSGQMATTTCAWIAQVNVVLC